MNRSTGIALAIAVVAFSLAGCASTGLGYVTTHYGSVAAVHYKHPATKTTFDIYDRPAENRLMISSNVGAAFMQGFTMGLTKTPQIIYEQAAVDFLASAGRSCTVTRSVLLVEPQYEVTYTCLTG